MGQNQNIKYYADILTPFYKSLAYSLIGGGIFFFIMYRAVRNDKGSLTLFLILLATFIFLVIFFSLRVNNRKLSIIEERISIPGSSQKEFKPNTFILDIRYRKHSTLSERFNYFFTKDNIKSIEVVSISWKDKDKHIEETAHAAAAEGIIKIIFKSPLKCQKIIRGFSIIYKKEEQSYATIKQIYLTLREPQSFIKDLNLK